MTEKEKMIAGKIYDPSDKELVELRTKAHRLSKEYNELLETDERRSEILKEQELHRRSRSAGNTGHQSAGQFPDPGKPCQDKASGDRGGSCRQPAECRFLCAGSQRKFIKKCSN